MFYQFEYQARHTIHLHMLIWVESLVEIDPLITQFKATVPMDNVDDAFFVSSLQQSDKSSPFLSVNEKASVSNQSFKPIFTPADAKLNIRAYIEPILFLLQSRMDVQTTDGKAALMRYVCTYVSKLAENVELLRNVDSSTFSQVWPFLIDLSPGEPEMTMSFYLSLQI